MDYGRLGNNYYGRDRSPSPRDRYRRDGSRGRDGYSGRDWSRNSDRRDYDRREPERHSSSWRRDSPDRSPRGRYHSRSRSRGRNRSRDASRSPRRRSSRRSSSYGSRKRFRRGSSSSSRSSSGSRSRSVSPRKKQEPKEDIFKSMYADREEQAQPAAYLHPSLNRNPVSAPANTAFQPPANVSTPPVTANIVAQAVSSTAGFEALSQAYGGNSPKKSYVQQEMDDEDRFLYGDDDHKPAQSSVQQQPASKPSDPPATKSKAVTPGGFDSNALKNVLKAIGFDFEMSAQQSQTAVQPPKEKTPPPPKPAPPPQPAKPPPPAEAPQRIQTIGTGPAPKPVQPAPVPPQIPTQQQYYQPYDPYNPESYTPQPVQPPVEAPATHLGYPITIQDPNNPGNTLLVYRPANPPTHPQVLYQHPPQPQAVVAPQGGRVVLPPQRQESVPEVKKSENDLRQERLNYLQAELEKLKKQQNELLRKKRREKDGHKDPLIKKNTMLQAGVEEQIREIKQAAEMAAGVESESSDDDDVPQKEAKEEKYVYFDPGNHWCRLCNGFSADLPVFLSHLHSKTHRKAIDPYDRPWDDGEKTKKPKTSDARSKALKGSEFFIPITGYYCKICQTFSGDQICADEHLKSRSHNAMYKKYCKKNPSYEKKYKKKKKAAMETTSSGEKKKEPKKEPVQAEVKFIPTLVKKEKQVTAYVREEPRYVEKESPKSYSGRDMKYVETPTQYFDQQLNHYQQSSQEFEKPEKREKKHKRPSRDHSSERERDSGRRRFEREEKQSRHREDRKSPRKYSDNYVERPQRSSEHGRRKKGWSPGYDEYEQQQQEDRYESRPQHSSERKARRSSSADRGEKWVEKPQVNDYKIRSDQPPVKDYKIRSDDRKPSKESIAAGAKIPTPGFGKFSWNSGANRFPRRFDQVPVDNVVPSRETIDNKNGEFSGKGKIAIKITGKTQYPPRMSSNMLSKGSPISSMEVVSEEKKASVALELQRKVEALKRENAVRNQLSSITLPSGRNAKQPAKPNTAAVMLGTRTIGKHNTLLLAKKNAKRKKEEEEVITQDIEVDVSPPPPPERPHQPPPPGDFEPPPPGEEDLSMGGIDNDGATSDASGISMELASDEE